MNKPEPFFHWEAGPYETGYHYRYRTYDMGVLVAGRLVVPTYMVLTAYGVLLVLAYIASLVFTAGYTAPSPSILAFVPLICVGLLGMVPLVIWGIRVVVSKMAEQIEWRGPR